MTSTDGAPARAAAARTASGASARSVTIDAGSIGRVAAVSRRARRRASAGPATATVSRSSPAGARTSARSAPATTRAASARSSSAPRERRAERGRGHGARESRQRLRRQARRLPIRLDDHRPEVSPQGRGRLHFVGWRRPCQTRRRPRSTPRRSSFATAITAPGGRRGCGRGKRIAARALPLLHRDDGAARDRDRVRRRQLERDPAALRHLAAGFAHTAHHADARADAAAARAERSLRGRPAPRAAGAGLLGRAARLDRRPRARHLRVHRLVRREPGRRAHALGHGLAHGRARQARLLRRPRDARSSRRCARRGSSCRRPCPRASC